MEFLTRLGIGAATVDTVLSKSDYEIGESVEGSVTIAGGSSSQQVDSIYLALLTRYKVETENGHAYRSGVIEKFPLNESFSISEGEEKSFPVSFHIPHRTPLTLGNTRVWVQTGLDVDWSLDPSDEDDLQIKPDARMGALLEAVDRLGFQLRKAECEQGGRLGAFVQEFSFRAHGGPFAGRLNELELICQAAVDHVDVILEIDHKAGGLMGMLGGEFESKSRVTVTDSDPAAIARSLQATIESRL